MADGPQNREQPWRAITRRRAQPARAPAIEYNRRSSSDLWFGSGFSCAIL